MEKYQVDCYTIRTIGIGSPGFHINIFSEFIFSIIIDLFLLYILLKGEH